MFPLCLQGIRAGLRQGGPGEAPRAAGPRHLCAQRLCLPHKYSKFLIKTYDCVNSAGRTPNLEKPFRHPPHPPPPHAGEPGPVLSLCWPRRSGNRGTGADDMRHLAGRSGEARAGQALSPASGPAVAGLGVGEGGTEQHCPAVPPAGSPAPWGAFPPLQGKTQLSPACATVPRAGCWGEHQRWEHKALQASCQEGVEAPARGRKSEERGSEKEERVNSSPSRSTHADPRGRGKSERDLGVERVSLGFKSQF